MIRVEWGLQSRSPAAGNNIVGAKEFGLEKVSKARREKLLMVELDAQGEGK